MRGGGANQSLLHNIVSLPNLLQAWKEFKRCKNSKKDIAEFEFNLENNLFSLHSNLINKTYISDPYQAFFVYDPKRRHIHKATVRDRVLHQAIFRILYPIFDKHFISDSYSSRKEKGTHKASQQLFVALRKESKNWRVPVFALKCDIRKFFDSVDHNILFELIKKKITDEETLTLIKQILDSFEVKNKVLITSVTAESVNISKQGLPLGNVTSQLFANIYLNELDQFVKHNLKVKSYFRYADDFVLLSGGRVTLESNTLELQNFLDKNLELQLHPSKISIRKVTQGVDFVGYVILPNAVVLRTKTKKRIFKKIKIAKDKLVNKKSTKENFNQTKTSYLGILTHCKDKEIKRGINRILL